MGNINKAKAKASKANNKIAAKSGKVKAAKCAAIAFALCAVAYGCATSDAPQPDKSISMENKFDDCIFVVASKCSVSNRIVRAEGTQDIPAVELFTQTQSLQNSGTENTTKTATQTPTTDVKPDIDVEVPVTKTGAAATAADAAAALVSGAASGAEAK